MSKRMTIELSVESWVLAELEAAVAAGEASSMSELIADIISQWLAARKANEPSYRTWAKDKIEESLRDPHPGYPLEEVFAEARASYAGPQSKAS